MDPARLNEFGNRYAKAWCSQDPESVAAFFSEGGSLSVNNNAPAVGREAIAKVALGFMTAFPDMVVTMDEVVPQSQDAIFRWTLTGTNTAPGGTGHRVRINGYEAWTFAADGLIAGSKGHFDADEYERQLEHGVNRQLGGHSMTAEDEVRQASDQFYAALTAMAGGDAGSMSAAWAHDGNVTAIHPIGERGEGWEQIRSQFDQVASIASGGHMRLSNQLIRVGTDLAYEVGTEEGEATLAGERVQFNHRVTNVYRRDGGVWKMIHHHSDSSPAMQDLLSRLQAPSH